MCYTVKIEIRIQTSIFHLHAFHTFSLTKQRKYTYMYILVYSSQSLLLVSITFKIQQIHIKLRLKKISNASQCNLKAGINIGNNFPFSIDEDIKKNIKHVYRHLE